MGGAIGIDLGTTNSCAACIVDGKSEIVLFPSGARTIPSVFAIDKQGKQLIGQEAKEHGLVSPDDTVMASKRLLGRSFKIPQVNQMKQIFTYELQEGESSEILVKVADQVLTLEQVSASILQRIKIAAEAHLDQAIDKAVITVPAYFNDRQRQSVRLAGKMAGLKVLRILNEPTAAALAYGLGRNVNQRVAVYDLGGGTFDISLIDIRNKVFEVLATGGDTFLGGVDFDDRVMQWVLQKFADDTGIDVSFDHGAVARVRDASETAKIRLSFTESTKLYLENIAQDEDGQWIHLDMKLNRRTLEELTGDLVERSIQTCDRILREAGSSKREVDELLLVGGQSRMPLVRAELERFLGKPSSQKVHPDEAVAIGAAIMAHTLSAKDEDDALTLLDVLPMAIGIAKSGGKMHVLFRNNQPLPDFKTRSLTTSKDNQRSILLRMYQGESEFVKDNEVLGTFTFSGLRQAPKGDVKLSATFHIDTEGILSITAVDGDSGEKVETQLTLGENPRGPEETRRKKKKKPIKKAEPTTLDTPQASMASSKKPASSPSSPKVSKPPLLTRMFSIFGTTTPAKKSKTSKKKTPPIKATKPKTKKATQTESSPKKKEAASITPPPLATPTASISKPKKSQAPKKKASTKKKGKSVAKKAKTKNDKTVKKPAKKRNIWRWFGSGKGGSK